MTYRKDFTLPAELMEQVSKQGLDILPELIQVVINAAMQAYGKSKQPPPGSGGGWGSLGPSVNILPGRRQELLAAPQDVDRG